MQEGGENSLVIVGDTDDPFVPAPFESLMYHVTEEREQLDIFIDKLYNMYSEEELK